MKKILGISLCALFAVSAANANIASQEYVDGLVGAIDTSGIATNAGDINTLKGRVDGHDESIAANAGDITTNAGNIAQNTTDIAANTTAIAGINEDIAGMTANVTGSHFIQGVSQANGIVTPTGKNFETTLSTTTNDNAPTSKAVADHVKGAINALNVTATTGDYVKVVSQSNGSVQATGASFDDEVTATSENAPTSKAVATYVDDKVSDLDVGTLEGRVTANANAISANTGNITANANAISGINNTIEGLELTETTGNYVKVVSQAGGQVSATAGNFESELDTGTTDNAPTSKAVANYVAENAIQGVTTGRTNGTILVDNQEVAVKGLQAMAYKASVTSAEIADRTIVNVDINDDAAIESSKIAFTDAQNTVFGSGINSGLVTQISTNTNNISQIGEQVTANKQDITSLKGRMTTAESKIGSNTTSINSILNATGATDCASSTAGCTLVLSSTGYKWETVKR